MNSEAKLQTPRKTSLEKSFQMKGHALLEREIIERGLKAIFLTWATIVDPLQFYKLLFMIEHWLQI